jgi:hypothetical protein
LGYRFLHYKEHGEALLEIHLTMPFKHFIGVTTNEVVLGENFLEMVLMLLSLGFRFHELHWNRNGKNHITSMLWGIQIHFDEC